MKGGGGSQGYFGVKGFTGKLDTGTRVTGNESNVSGVTGGRGPSSERSTLDVYNYSKFHCKARVLS